MTGTALQIRDPLADNPAILSCDPVGSRMTCTPPPTDTDEDWLILVSDLDKVSSDLQLAGFDQDGNPELYSGMDEEHFRSFRRGNVNVVLTSDYGFHERFMVATQLAARFNLLEKVDRIALFQGVLYGAAARDIKSIRVRDGLYARRRAASPAPVTLTCAAPPAPVAVSIEP